MQGSTKQKSLVKKETVILIGIAALVIGFLGGIVFNTYKSAPGQNYAASGQQAASQGQQGSSAEAIPADKATTILALERELAADPDNAKGWISLGNLYFDTDQPEKAIKAYSKSLDLAPNNANVLTDLGIMYRRAGQPQQAVEAFDKAAKIDPKQEQALFNKGVVLLGDLLDKDGAIKAWEKLLALNPAAKAPNGQSLKELVEQIKAEK